MTDYFKKPVPQFRTIVNGIWSDLMDLFHSSFEVSNRGNVGLGVYIQDQTTEILNVRFVKQLGEFSLVIDTNVNDYSITVSTGHGIAAGNLVELAQSDGGEFMQARVLGVNGDIITLDSPINYPYKTTDLGSYSTDDMRVDGSITPQIFKVEPFPTQSGDINSINLVLESTQAMDYTKFAALPSLLRGCVIRVNHGDGTYRNLFNWKNNGQFIIESSGHYFQEKAGGGEYGFLAQVIFNGQQNRGVTIRLDGSLGESLEVLVQDDLTDPGLTSFKIIAYGSELQD